jgi:hypothetical protein
MAYTADIAQIPVPFAGTLQNFYVRHNSVPPGSNANAVVYTVMRNGVATAITVSLAANSGGQAADLVNTVAVVAGDRVSIRAVKAANIGGGSINVQASLEVG